MAVLCEGDPFFYGSYMYVHNRLADRFETTVVPGIPSLVAGAAASPAPGLRQRGPQRPERRHVRSRS